MDINAALLEKDGKQPKQNSKKEIFPKSHADKLCSMLVKCKYHDI